MKKLLLLLLFIVFLGEIAFAQVLDIRHISGNLVLGESAIFKPVVPPWSQFKYWSFESPTGNSLTTQPLTEVRVLFEHPGTYVISLAAVLNCLTMPTPTVAQYTVDIKDKPTPPSSNNGIKIMKGAKGNYFSFYVYADAQVTSDVDLEFVVTYGVCGQHKYNVTIKKGSSMLIDLISNIPVIDDRGLLTRVYLRSCRVSPSYDHIFNYYITNTTGLEL